MGCNVSKDQQVEKSGGDDAIKSTGKSKNKKGKKSTASLEVNSFNANESTNRKGGDTRENGTTESKTGKEDEEMNLDPSDPSLNAAASKIQASFRGHKVRKELKKTADEIDLLPTPRALLQNNGTTPTTEEVDVDLSDPEVQKAATKIQASFRGYMVRKQKDGGSSPTSENAGS